MNKKLYSLMLAGLSLMISFSVKAQVNDLPCNAIFLPFGIYIAGNNTGATSTSEPAGTPTCFDAGGARNTVWYRFTAPASGCVKIKTVSNSLTDTQIALFSGTCGALGAELVCNNDATGCAATTYPHSQMQVCGLIPGTTYFIVVDGRANNVGSFSIMVFDGGVGNVNPFPPAPIQDCLLPQLICGTSISYPDPGFRGVGNICDHAPSNCLASGERGSAWFRLVCNGTGNIAFTIVPNNWTGGATGTDYDFGVWRNGGPTGPNYDCSTLQGNMVRCNYSAIGVTGCYLGGGVAPPGYPGSGGAFGAEIPVVAGDILLIEISNFAISNTGFSATFTGPIATASSPGGTLVWTGTVSTDWFNINNWGGCAIPTCQTNVIIPNFTPFQPIITGQNASCRNIDINLGASLTLNTGWQLMVCNDYLNNGVFTANNNSMILLSDTCTICPPVCGTCAAGINHNQIIGGNMTGANQFWHVTTSKPPGLSARAVQDIDMAGNFTVTGGVPYGGTFDASGIYHRVAGNINVQPGPPAGTYNAAATLEHYGTAGATYYNAGFINSMTMNHSGTGLTLLTLMQMTPSGTLTLNNGKIITGAFRVDVYNRALNGITAGNVNSYVENNSPAAVNTGLRKYLWNTGGAIGQYEFPVGTAAKGYQRMSWTVSTAWPAYASMNYCTVTFNNNWPTAAGSNPALGPECTAPNYHTGGAFSLDNGVWEVRPNAAATFNTTGNMDVTLYNRSYTNPSVGYTVQYNKTSGAASITTAANWQLNPFPTGCFGNPPITAVVRRGLAINTVLASFPLTAITYFNTAQTIQPLPVHLQSFDAIPLSNQIEARWSTASESENKGFELERTTNPPDNFEKIAWVDGHGSTTNANHYKFMDNDVRQDITYYYRLKQIDFNGNYEYSKITSASIGGDVLGFKFNTIPNPYSGSTSITYTLKENSKVRIEIINVMGQQVKELYNNDQEAGDYHYEFSAKAMGYPTGVYTVKVYINDLNFSKRILETE